MQEIDLKREKILIVEDSPTQAILLEKALTDQNLLVQVAANGVEALRLLPQFSPTVIITDIEMPEMNGYELCKRVKQDPAFSDIPVILLTNLTDPKDAIKGIECGADNFVTKPCQVPFLLMTIVDALQNRRRSHGGMSGDKTEFIFRGEKHLLQINYKQVTDLLLSTFASAIQKNKELEQAYRQLNCAHEEMEKKNSQLEKLNQEKNQFLGMAAHDLRNPLVVILRYSQMMRERLPSHGNESEEMMLQKIAQSSTFMLQLINDLLDISAIESGNVHLHLSENDPNQIIDEAILLTTHQAEKKQIALVKQSLHPTFLLHCDKDKLEQVFVNLLGNAIKFCHVGQSIEIALSAQPEEVIFSVKDHGVGLSANKMENLFQPFAKTSSKGTAGEAGTGLGLAIVKKIVLAHKGRVWAESEEGKGCTFYVALPYGK